MDDNTIFNKQNNQQPTSSNPPAGTEGQGQKLTAQDLYGPSVSPAGLSQALPQTPGAPQDLPATPVGAEIPVPQTVQNQNNVQLPVQEAVSTETTDTTGQNQSLPPQSDFPPPENKLTYLLGNKKLFLGMVIGALIIFIIFVGLIVRIFSKPSGPAYSKATLVYWGLWEDAGTMQAVINDFEKKYPGLKVTYEKQDPQRYKERLLTRIKNNTEAPDIFTFHNSWTPTLIGTANNILSPLPNNVITPEEFKQTYFSIVQKDLTKNGAIYGLPQGIDTLALFINKDIFTAARFKAPLTWEEFNLAAKTLTVKDETGKIKTAGVSLGSFDNVTHAPDIVSLLMMVNGVDLNLIADHREYLKGAILYYTSFVKGKESVWDKTFSSSREVFASGNLAMYFGYSWDIFAIKAANKNLQFEVHPLPYLPKEGGTPFKVAVGSYWANGVSVKTKHQKEAFLLMKYISEKETAQKLYTEASKTRLFGMPYARKDLASTLSKDPMIYPFIQQADYALSTYFSGNTYDPFYNGPLNDYLGNAIRFEPTSRVSIDTAIETMLNGVKQVRSQAEQ